MASVFIQINDQYAIGSDKAARAWTIQRLKGNSWRDVSWFNTLQGAVNSLSETMLKQSGAQNMGELVQALEDIKKTLSNAIARHFDIDLYQISSPIATSDEQTRE